MDILFINNYDSFVYNLVNYFSQLEPKSNIFVEKNSVSLEYVKSLSVDKIVISPGPGHPKYDTGSVISIIKEFYSEVPILGICLGHQTIVEAFGDDTSKDYVDRATVGPMHGKISKIFHDQATIFSNIPNPLLGIRYHSFGDIYEFRVHSRKIMFYSNGIANYEIYTPSSMLMPPMSNRMGCYFSLRTKPIGT